MLKLNIEMVAVRWKGGYPFKFDLAAMIGVVHVPCVRVSCRAPSVTSVAT